MQRRENKGSENVKRRQTRGPKIQDKENEVKCVQLTCRPTARGHVSGPYWLHVICSPQSHLPIPNMRRACFSTVASSKITPLSLYFPNCKIQFPILLPYIKKIFFAYCILKISSFWLNTFQNYSFDEYPSNYVFLFFKLHPLTPFRSNINENSKNK